MKRAIVISLEAACGVVHHLPILKRYMPCYLANWSDALDQRWGTHVWTTPQELSHT